MMTDRLAANVAARQSAEEVFGLAIDEAGGLLKAHDAKAVSRFWIELRQLIDETIPKAKPEPDDDSLPTMTDQEAREIGEALMPFGIHEGKRVEDVPEHYLDYITQTDEFKLNVIRYLRHNATGLD